MFFSIVVPAYNAEKYIARCLDSVIQQKFSDFEIIVINDGSYDSTLEILNCNYSKYENIKVITTVNCGVSAARNKGIGEAVGDYLIFLDADDWVIDGYFDYLYSILTDNQVDGVVLGHLLGQGDVSTKINNIKRDHIVGAKEYRKLYLNGKVSNNPWDKVFKRKLFKDNLLTFPEGINLGEDAVISAKLGIFSKDIYLSSHAFVNYMADTSGVTKGRYTSKHFSSLDSALSIIIEDYSEYASEKLLKKFYLIKMATMFSKEPRVNYLKSLYYKKLKYVSSELSLSDFESIQERVLVYPLVPLTRVNALPVYFTYLGILRYCYCFFSKLKLYIK
ncbi:glycosyltransferase family 2 protein [Photobacterium damselae]